MISNLKINNFKAFGETVEIDFKNLTLISGLNSGGKSSIYQSLLLLAESENSILKENGVDYPILTLNTDILELGKSEEILNDKNNKLIEFEITIKKIKKIMHFELVNNFKEHKKSIFMLKYLKVVFEENKYYEIKRNDNFTWDAIGCGIFNFESIFIKEFIVNRIDKVFNEKHPQKPTEILEASKNFDKNDYFNGIVAFKSIKSINFMNLFMHNIIIDIDEVATCIEPKYLPYFDLDLFKEDLRDGEFNESYLRLLNNNLDYLEYPLQTELNEFNFLKPFRGTPKRVYRNGLDKEPLKDFNNKNKIFYDFNLETNKMVKGTIKEAFKYWCIDFFKIADDIIIEEPVQGLLTEIFLIKGGKKIPINNLGFGISQIIPVIYKTLVSDSNFLIVDEPEIHLHPKMQSLLGDFFFKMSLLRKKIFIETHSEYIIDKLIFLQIKYKKNDNINMYWIEQENNHSIIKELKHDELGYIINPPENFLSEKRKMAEELTQLRLERLEDE